MTGCPGPETRLADLDTPRGRAVLKGLGLGPLLEEVSRSPVVRYLRLGTALSARGVSWERFASAWEAGETGGPGEAGAESAGDTANGGEVRLADYVTRQGELDLLGLMPCPLKVPFERLLAMFLAGQDAKITYAIEGNATLETTYYDLVPHFREASEIPGLVISPGLNTFFSKAFAGRFMDQGQFADALPPGEAGQGEFRDLGYRDPLGRYTMLSMNLLIMLVDHNKLAGASCPRRWADLLSPALANKVGIRGHGADFCETLLMNMHHAFGWDGVEALARVTMGGYHPSELVKLAGSTRPGPAVAVVPHFFASKAASRPGVEVVWPEDGAIVSPVFLLAKRQAMEAHPALVEFITGPQVGQAFADADFPSLTPGVVNRLPEDVPLRWVGWDYIHGHDLGPLKRELNDFFLAKRGQAPSQSSGGSICGL